MKISRHPNRALQSTLRRSCHDDSFADSYVTMNQKMLKEWPDYHCPQSYGEPITAPFFQGEFDGKTVFQNDFKKDVILFGRPSTSFKKSETTHVKNAAFHSETTNKSDYKLPQIFTREQVHLRQDAKKNKETMDTSNEKMDALTQYQRDNPGFRHLPVKQCLLAPQPDNLKLFAGPQQTITENQANYKYFQNAPRPRTTCKKKQQHHANSGQFDDRTSFKTDFQPIPLEEMMAQAQIDKQAAAIGATYKMGAQAKQAQDYGHRFTGKTTNSVHFQQWNVSPRIRHGDRSEITYRPSNHPFNVKSETSTNFVPMTVRPSKSCKPLDVHFGQQSSLCQAMASTTSYGDHFLPKPLPPKEQCPAELLLGL